MKKFAMLLSVLLLGMTVSIPVFAETDDPVWAETNVGTDNDLSVSIETNGTLTDGVVTIDYPSAVSCTEEDVEIADSVEMYSVNVVDGSVRISFLAGDAIKAGSIAEIDFEVKDENADINALKDLITLSGTVYYVGQNGEDVFIVESDKGDDNKDDDNKDDDNKDDDNKDDDNKGDGEGNSGQQSPGNDDEGDNEDDTDTETDVSTGNVSTSQTAKTGDTAEVYIYLTVLLVAGALLAAFVIVKRAKANTTGKSNQ